MRRFRNGATQRPIFKRPGVAYGQYCYGAPGPTREIEQRAAIVPEMFIENSEQPVQQTYFVDEHVHSGKTGQANSPENNGNSKTIIDLRDI